MKSRAIFLANNDGQHLRVLGTDVTLKATVDDTAHVATAGAFVTIPPRAIHGFVVTSAQARFLHVSIGAGATAMSRTTHKPCPTRPTPATPPPSQRSSE